MKFSAKIDFPSSLRNLDSLEVVLREDYFSVSAVEFRGKKFTHWLLKVNYFYHALPKLSAWRRASQGTVELEIAKALRIVWRNLHHEATKVWPNQYLWAEIMHKYRDDFDGDFEMGIFGKAEQRMQEEEDKMNLRRDQRAQDRATGRRVAQELRATHSKILARSRVAAPHAAGLRLPREVAPPGPPRLGRLLHVLAGLVD